MNSSQIFSIAAELPRRCKLPEHLYVVVDDVAFPTIDDNNGSVITPRLGDFHAESEFACGDISRDRIRSYLRHRNSSSAESCFISTFEHEEAALRLTPFCASEMVRSRVYIPHAIKLIIDTSALHAGWVDTASGRIPVWLEHGALPKVPSGVLYMTAEGVEAFDASIWICIAEVRNVLGLKPHDGEKGEWLACGHIPRSMVGAQVVLHDYQRQQKGASRPVLRRVGSLGSISSEEQEAHLKEQIARNRASREDLRLRAMAKKPACEKGDSLLRQAMGNRQAQKQAERNDALEARHQPPRAEKTPDRQVTFAIPVDPAGKNIMHHTTTHYTSVRSPQLREALEQSQATRSNESLNSMSSLTESNPLNKKNKPTERLSFQAARHPSLPEDFSSTCAGAGPSSPSQRSTPRQAAKEEDPYEQTFPEPARQNLLSVGSIPAQPARAADAAADRETLAPSERLWRARAGKKKAPPMPNSANNTTPSSNDRAHGNCEASSPDASSDAQTSASERAFGKRRGRETRRVPRAPRGGWEVRFLEDRGGGLDDDAPRYVRVDAREPVGRSNIYTWYTSGERQVEYKLDGGMGRKKG